jgi:PST family polysaccharide transporter
VISPLKKKTILGVIWAGFGSIGSQAIHYIVLLLLAWLLEPADFGLLGIAMMFILFTQAITELGFGAAIIQHPEIKEPGLSTAFWANLAIGIVLGVITYFGAEVITGFIGDVKAAPLLEVLAVIFPITAVAVVPRALLEKQLEFRQLTTCDFASEVAFGITGISMALLGYGVWSLVGAAIAQRLFNSIALFLIIKWRPKVKFSYDSMQSLIHFGGFAMIASLLNKGVANIDYFVIGRWLGTEALGFYTLAFQLSVVPERRVIAVIQRVVFPAFSVVQDNLKRLTSGFKESLRYLFVALSALCFFGVILAPWFIEALYSDKWQATIVPLQILAVAGFFYGFEVSEMVFYAVGKPQLRIWIIGLRMCLFMVFAITFGVSNGIVGIALSLTLSVAIASIVSLFLVAKVTYTRWVEFLQPIWPSVLSAIVASILVLAIMFLLRTVIEDVSPWIILISSGLTLVGLYSIMIVMTYPTILDQVRTGMRQVIRR